MSPQVAFLVLCIASSDGLQSGVSQEQEAQIVATAGRGITGTFLFTYSGPSLRVRTQREADAPLSLRLRHTERPDQYELRFIGTKEGVFDLRDRLEHAGGSTVKDLPSMLVSIVSALPKDHRSDLFEAADFQPRLTGGYRVGLVVAVIVWIAIPLIVYAIEVLRRPRPVTAPPTSPPLTIADQLRPLVEAAANRRLSTPEKGRLELLLVHYWRERAALPDLNMASAIQQLRCHAEAGPLLQAVENWLHRAESFALTGSPSSGPAGIEDRSPDAILRLLQPYHSVAASDAEHAFMSKESQ